MVCNQIECVESDKKKSVSKQTGFVTLLYWKGDGNVEAKLRWGVTKVPWQVLYEPSWVSETRWLTPNFIWLTFPSGIRFKVDYGTRNCSLKGDFHWIVFFLLKPLPAGILVLFFEAGDTQSEGCTFSEKEPFQTLIHLCAFDFAFITFVFVRM